MKIIKKRKLKKFPKLKKWMKIMKKRKLKEGRPLVLAAKKKKSPKINPNLIKSARKERGDPTDKEKKLKKHLSEDNLKAVIEKEKRKAAELEETIKLLETKIISITSINAALEDQLDQTLEENRKLLKERIDAHKKHSKKDRKKTKK